MAIFRVDQAFFGPNFYTKTRSQHLVLLIIPKLFELQTSKLYQIVALN